MKIQWNRPPIKTKTTAIKVINVHYNKHHKNIIKFNKIIKEHNIK